MLPNVVFDVGLRDYMRTPWVFLFGLIRVEKEIEELMKNQERRK